FQALGTILAGLPGQPRYGNPPPSVPARTVLDEPPVFDRLQARSHVVVPDRIANSEFNTAHRGKAEMHPFATLDEMFRNISQIVSTGNERNYVYAYWPELDRLSHEHGIASRKAVVHLGELDRACGKLVRAVSGTDTTVIVTSDHGFIDSRPDHVIDLEAHPQLARTLALPLCGERRASYCYVHESQRAEFADYVTSHLGEYVDLKE